MVDVQRVRDWLAEAPGLSGLTVDYIADGRGSAGLFLETPEVLSTQTDFHGGKRSVCRAAFTVYRRMAGAGDGTENARWLQNFWEWLQGQSNGSVWLQLGDMPQCEKILPGKGALKSVSGDGVATYAVTLQIEFVKHY